MAGAVVVSATSTLARWARRGSVVLVLLGAHAREARGAPPAGEPAAPPRADAAPASPRTITLTVEAAPGLSRCPDAASLRELIAARLGYDPVQRDAETAFVVRFSEEAPAIVASLQRRSRDGAARGSRAMRSETGDCLELASSVALAAALAIDPEASARAAAAPPAPAPEVAKEPPAAAPPPPPAPAPPAEVAAAPTSPGPAWALVVGAGPTVGAGHVPGVSVGPRAGVGVRRGALALEIAGTAIVEGTEAVGSGAVGASTMFASLLPCARWTASPSWSGDLCAEGQLGALFASAEGVDRASPTTRPVGAVGARASVELPLGAPLSVRLTTSVVAQLAREHLLIDDGGRQVEVWATPPIAFLAGLEPLLVFR